LAKEGKMAEKIQRAGEFLEKICDKALLLLSMLILWGLTGYSMLYTVELREGTEVPITVRDSMGENLLVLLTVVLALFLLRRFFKRRLLKDKAALSVGKVRMAVGIAAAYVGIASIVWVSICHVKARADGESLCYVAKLIMRKGDFGTMVPPGYMSYNPHQFSLLAVIQILFKLFGVGQYRAFQYMNALCMPLLFYAGYKILQLIYGKLEIVCYYICLFVCCLPLFLYVPYVYGEITSITFTMVVMWQVIRYCKTGKKTGLLWGTLAAVFACIMRMNSLIVLVAAGIVLVVYAIRARKPLAIVWLLVMLAAVQVTDGAIRKYYEHISGMEVLDGIPYISYVYMGLQDGARGPGWYNQSNYTELELNDFDTEKTAQEDMAAVQDRLRELWSDKSYGIDFFKRKILSQWNSPACHVLFETHKFDCEQEELPAVVRRIYYDDNEFVRAFMNRYQFILYFGTAIMTTVSFLRKQKKIALENRLLLIAIVGGFLFSIIWEAMSRYVLPYVVYMIPLAAVGMWYLQELLEKTIAFLYNKYNDI
jgi:hypothetical protein